MTRLPETKPMSKKINGVSQKFCRHPSKSYSIRNARGKHSPSALLGAAAAHLPEISTAAIDATNAAQCAVRLFAETGFLRVAFLVSPFAFRLF